MNALGHVVTVTLSGVIEPGARRSVSSGDIRSSETYALRTPPATIANRPMPCA